MGVMQPFEAMRVARERGLDLVEISPNADPPVCKITDYGKFLYQTNKKAHEQRKHQKGHRREHGATPPRLRYHLVFASEETCTGWPSLASNFSHSPSKKKAGNRNSSGEPQGNTDLHSL